jgi:hypothetical protein
MTIRARGGSAASQDTMPIRTGRTTAPFRAAISGSGPRSAISFPLMVAAVHYLIVQLAATLAWRYGTSTSPSGPSRYVPHQLNDTVNNLVGPLRLWDGLWYALVADTGYKDWTPKAAFWPLFPWTMDLVSDLTGIVPDVAGYLIANICFVIALILLYRLVAIDFDERIARGTLWAIALFPTALFFSAVYTESPFLMLSVGALLSARLRQWWLAGVLGALAALTRSYGVFLGLPFLVLYLQQYGNPLKALHPRILAIGFPLAGPAIFSWHLDRLFDKPLLWKDVQNQWNRYSAMPWETLRWAFSESPRGREINVRDGADWSWLRDLWDHKSWSFFTSHDFRLQVANSDTLELACTLLFIGLAVIGLWKLPLYQSAWLIPGIAVPLFQPSSVHVLMSMPRFGLTLFPLFVVLAWLFRSRILAIPVAAVSTVLLVLLTIQFANWYWVS